MQMSGARRPRRDEMKIIWIFIALLLGIAFGYNWAFQALTYIQ